jgi:hypothetical protein
MKLFSLKVKDKGVFNLENLFFDIDSKGILNRANQRKHQRDTNDGIKLNSSEFSNS